MKSKMLTQAVLAVAAVTVGLVAASPAHAWDWFRRETAEVREGNRALNDGQARAALEHYDRARARLPSAPGLSLDRGLALLAAGDLEGAKTALLEASEPPATPELRAQAFYNLGIAFYREGERPAEDGENEDPSEQKRLFTEAADAFVRALRSRPGFADAAWNLELARRRIAEAEEAERAQQQEEEEQAENEDEPNEGEEQEKTEENETGESGDKAEDGGDENEDASPESQDEPDEPDEPDPQGGSDGANQAGEPERGDGADEGQPEPGPNQDPPSPPDPSPAQPPEASPDRLSPEQRQILDALQNREENFQRYRAGQGRRRPVQQDW